MKSSKVRPSLISLFVVALVGCFLLGQRWSGSSNSLWTERLGAVISLQSAASQLQWKDLLGKDQIDHLRFILRNWERIGLTSEQIVHLSLPMVLDMQKRFCLHGAKVREDCFDGGAGLDQLLHYFHLMMKHRQENRLSAPVYCETGFNYGGSALTALLAGYRVFSFDVQVHPYSKASVRLLQTLFPNQLEIIVGDSLKTLGKFSSDHPNVKCNVVSVDGRHTGPYVKKDSELFQRFVTPLNLFFVDDTGPTYMNGEMRGAWNDLKSAKILTETECVHIGIVETMRGPRDLGYCIGVLKPTIKV